VGTNVARINVYDVTIDFPATAGSGPDPAVVHFDLYDTVTSVTDVTQHGKRSTVAEKAPFSHDAEVAGDFFIPEPGTLMIWGVGGLCAAGAAAMGRRRKAAPPRARWSDETRNAVFSVVHVDRR
jgi:hypothetical protein